MAFSRAQRDLQGLLPSPRRRSSCCLSGVRPATPGPRLSALQRRRWGGGQSPREAEGTCQQLTSQQSPLPVCNLTRQPCPVDRDLAGASFPGRKRWLQGSWGVPPALPHLQGLQSLAKDLLTPAMLSGHTRRLQEAVSDRAAQVYTGHVNQGPGACSPRWRLSPSRPCPCPCRPSVRQRWQGGARGINRFLKSNLFQL